MEAESLLRGKQKWGNLFKEAESKIALQVMGRHRTAEAGLMGKMGRFAPSAASKQKKLKKASENPEEQGCLTRCP